MTWRLTDCKNKQKHTPINVETKQYATEKQKVSKEIKEEIKKLLTNENGNTTFEMNTAKADPKGKFIMTCAYLKKLEKF